MITYRAGAVELPEPSQLEESPDAELTKFKEDLMLELDRLSHQSDSEEAEDENDRYHREMALNWCLGKVNRLLAQRSQ